MLLITEHTNDGNERVGVFRVVVFVLVGERHDEVSVTRTCAVADLGHDVRAYTVYDLSVERHIVSGEVDRLRVSGKWEAKDENKNSQRHASTKTIDSRVPLIPWFYPADAIAHYGPV